MALYDGWVALLGRDTPITKLFLGLNIAIFAMALLNQRSFPGLMGGMRMSEDFRWGMMTPLLAREEPFRYLSAVFVHLGILHLVMNMSALRSFGERLEGTIGPSRFTVVFVVTGALGFVASDFWYTLQGTPMQPTAGASGALFGIAAAVVGHAGAARDPSWKEQLIRLIVAGVVIALIMPVNNAAHAGGLVSGLVLGFVLYYEGRRGWRRDWLFRPVAALCVLASLGSVVASTQSDVWRQVREVEIERGID